MENNEIADEEPSKDDIRHGENAFVALFSGSSSQHMIQELETPWQNAALIEDRQ
jgi:hypothetical protein